MGVAIFPIDFYLQKQLAVRFGPQAVDLAPVTWQREAVTLDPRPQSNINQVVPLHLQWLSDSINDLAQK